MKIRSYNDQRSTRIPVIPIVTGLKFSAQTLRIQPLKPVLLIVANREKQLSLNRRDRKWFKIFYQEIAKPRAEHGTAEETKALLAKAVDLIAKEGAAAFPKINAGEDGLKDRDLYLFVHNTEAQAKGVAYGGPKLKHDPIRMPAIEVVGFDG